MKRKLINRKNLIQSEEISQSMIIEINKILLP